MTTEFTSERAGKDCRRCRLGHPVERRGDGVFVHPPTARITYETRCRAQDIWRKAYLERPSHD